MAVREHWLMVQEGKNKVGMVMQWQLHIGLQDSGVRNPVTWLALSPPAGFSHPFGLILPCIGFQKGVS